MDISALLAEKTLITNVVLSLLALFAILGTRHLILNLIANRDVGGDIANRRRRIVRVKNTAWMVLVLVVFAIWAAELRTIAVSLFAVAVALVIATKEYTTSILGGLMRTGTQMYTVGDRIELVGLRGDVIDLSFVTTTLFEIGPGKESHQATGRIIVFPNSLLLSNAVINETETGNFVLHVFKIPLFRHDDWKAERQKVLKAAGEVCSEFIEQARRQFLMITKKQGIDTPSVEPRVVIIMPEADKIDLIVRVPAPSRRKGRIEQAIISRYLEISDEAGISAGN